VEPNKQFYNTVHLNKQLYNKRAKQIFLCLESNKSKSSELNSQLKILQHPIRQDDNKLNTSEQVKELWQFFGQCVHDTTITWPTAE